MLTSKEREQVKAINDDRIDENNRRKAEAYAAQLAHDEAVCLNAFLKKHTGMMALQNGTVFDCFEANVDVLMKAARSMHVRWDTTGQVLEEVWRECESKLAKYRTTLSDAEKDRVIRAYLYETKKLDPNKIYRFSQEEKDAAEPFCQERFRRAEARRDYQAQTTEHPMKHAPQQFRPSFPTPPLPFTREAWLNFSTEEQRRTVDKYGSARINELLNPS
jgi:hypothetical protein